MGAFGDYEFYEPFEDMDVTDMDMSSVSTGIHDVTFDDVQPLPLCEGTAKFCQSTAKHEDHRTSSPICMPLDCLQNDNNNNDKRVPTGKQLWLEALMQDFPMASQKDVLRVLGRNPTMASFWNAEHATLLQGWAGGGIQYLVARAFQGSKMIRYSQLPMFQEAVFHLRNFSLCMSMTAGQATKHAQLTSMILAACGFGNCSLFTTTHIPSTQAQARKIYGPGGGPDSFMQTSRVLRYTR